MQHLVFGIQLLRPKFTVIMRGFIIALVAILASASLGHCLKPRNYNVHSHSGGWQQPPHTGYTSTPPLTAAEIIVKGDVYTEIWPRKRVRRKVIQINIADGASAFFRLCVVPFCTYAFAAANENGTLLFWQFLFGLSTLRRKLLVLSKTLVLPVDTTSEEHIRRVDVQIAIARGSSTINELLDCALRECLYLSIGCVSLLLSATLLLWSIRLANLWHFLPDQTSWIEPAALALPFLIALGLAAAAQGAVDDLFNSMQRRRPTLNGGHR